MHDIWAKINITNKLIKKYKYAEFKIKPLIYCVCTVFSIVLIRFLYLLIHTLEPVDRALSAHARVGPGHRSPMLCFCMEAVIVEPGVYA